MRASRWQDFGSFEPKKTKMSEKSVTEQASYYDNLEHMSVLELLRNMNREDRKVPEAVGECHSTDRAPCRGDRRSV